MNTEAKDKYLQSFKNVLQAKFPKTSRTQTIYLGVLKKFLNEFTVDPKRATTQDLTAYIGSIKGESLARQMHGVLKNFYAHVLKQPNKITFVPFPAKSDRLPDLIDRNEVLEMLALTDNLKHKAIITMLYSTGMRLSELIDLSLKDVQDGVITIRNGKGSKGRRVPFKGIAAEIYNEYLIYYHPKEYVFENPKGGQYSPTSVQIVIKEAALRAGIEKKVTPHTLRHSFATHLRDRGIDLATIGDLLGHSNPRTTKIYARLSNYHIGNLPELI